MMDLNELGWARCNDIRIPSTFAKLCEENDTMFVNMELEMNIDTIQKHEINDGFCYACLNGNLEIMKLILEKVDNFGAIDQAFFCCIKGGHLDAIKLLEEHRPYYDLSSCNDKGFYLACENGHLEIAKYFLIHYFPNIQNNDYGAVMKAAQNEYIDILKIIFYKYNLNIFINNGQLIKNAVIFSKEKLKIFLLEQLSNLKGKSKRDAFLSLCMLNGYGHHFVNSTNFTDVKVDRGMLEICYYNKYFEMFLFIINNMTTLNKRDIHYFLLKIDDYNNGFSTIVENLIEKLDNIPENVLDFIVENTLKRDKYHAIISLIINKFTTKIFSDITFKSICDKLFIFDKPTKIKISEDHRIKQIEVVFPFFLTDKKLSEYALFVTQYIRVPISNELKNATLQNAIDLNRYHLFDILLVQFGDFIPSSSLINDVYTMNNFINTSTIKRLCENYRKYEIPISISEDSLEEIIDRDLCEHMEILIKHKVNLDSVHSFEHYDWVSDRMKILLSDYFKDRLLLNLKEIDESIEKITCPICHDADSELITSCKHQFCKECIGNWIKRSMSCPYCRKML